MQPLKLNQAAGRDKNRIPRGARASGEAAGYLLVPYKCTLKLILTYVAVRSATDQPI